MSGFTVEIVNTVFFVTLGAWTTTRTAGGVGYLVKDIPDFLISVLEKLLETEAEAVPADRFLGAGKVQTQHSPIDSGEYHTKTHSVTHKGT